MFALAVLAGLLAQTVLAEQLTCGNSDAQTAPLRSPAGFTVLLRMHSEDDHGRNTHLCMADYTIEATRPDGTAAKPDQFISSDGEWSRSLTFRIDGFSKDGNIAYAYIADGSPPTLNAEAYDLRTGTSLGVFVDLGFAKRLDSACAATVHIFGILPTGQMVLATTAGGSCHHPSYWVLRPSRNSGKSGGQLPERPSLLPSDAGVTPLDPGKPVAR